MAHNAHAGPSTASDTGASATSPRPVASTATASAPTNRLYVGNLASSVDEYALIQLFQRFGKLTKLDFMYHKTGALKGKPRGYAFIELSTKEVSRAHLAAQIVRAKHASFRLAFQGCSKSHDQAP
jgi:RNA recognition motif-containing protein